MRKFLKHRLLALSLVLGLASLVAGVSVSACSRLIIYRTAPGRYLVCELTGGTIYRDGSEVCSYICNAR